MTENKAFLTTQVGSWPRSKEMLKMLCGYQKGKVSRAEFDTMAEGEIRRTVALQEQAGLDIVVDGEHRRESFYAFITDKVAGTQLMSLADMLINRITKGVDGIRIGVHICRGNWSKQEEVLLTGDYARLLPALERMNINQFVLESKPRKF